jgi:RNA polymerase sigma factor (sigma-70 family)
MAEAEDHWQRLIQGLRDGDPQAVREFCARYGELLHRLADKHLAEGLRRRVSPEDVVQSACRTFLRRAQGGQFHLADSASLWRLLCAITLAKVREQARFHLRQKRGFDQEVQAVPGDASGVSFHPVDPNPSPAEAAELADQFQQLLATLDDEERQIVDLKLQEYTNDEVAQHLGCSERTVRRILKRVQARLARALEAP